VEFVCGRAKKRIPSPLLPVPFTTPFPPSFIFAAFARFHSLIHCIAAAEKGITQSRPKGLPSKGPYPRRRRRRPSTRRSRHLSASPLSSSQASCTQPPIRCAIRCCRHQQGPTRGPVSESANMSISHGGDQQGTAYAQVEIEFECLRNLHGSAKCHPIGIQWKDAEMLRRPVRSTSHSLPLVFNKTPEGFNRVQKENSSIERNPSNLPDPALQSLYYWLPSGFRNVAHLESYTLNR
jgi:hypothetical protein